MNTATGRNDLQPAKAGEDGTVAQESNFTWTQQDDEVEIVFPFEIDLDKKKLKVLFLPRSVKIVYEGSTFLEIRLYGKVDVDGCVWTMDGKRKVVMTMEKGEEGTSWPRITEGA